MSHETIDPVKELRLRRWARENYVPMDQRSLDWHPVVLQEMCDRDEELSRNPEQNSRNTDYVPLAPSETYVLHPGHASVKEPNIARQRVRTDEYAQQGWKKYH